MEATLRRLTCTFSQKDYDRYLRQEIRAMTKARDAGHRDFAAWTDAEIHAAAAHLARINHAGERYA